MKYAREIYTVLELIFMGAVLYLLSGLLGRQIVFYPGTDLLAVILILMAVPFGVGFLAGRGK